MLFRGIKIMEKYIFENNIPLVTDNREKKKQKEKEKETRNGTRNF